MAGVSGVGDCGSQLPDLKSKQICSLTFSVFRHLWLSQGVHSECKFGYPPKSGDNGQTCAVIFTLGLREVGAL